MRWVCCVSLVLLLVSTQSASAAKHSIDKQTKGEIVHLLSFVEQSDCVFIRNGETFTGARAREHIQGKYNHLRKKITSTEDFILYAASRSSLSRSSYQVNCGTVTMRSGDWLSEELAVYRKTAASNSSSPSE